MFECPFARLFDVLFSPADSGLLTGIMLLEDAWMSCKKISIIVAGGTDSEEGAKPGAATSLLRASLSPIVGCVGKSLAALGISVCEESNVDHQSVPA